MFEASDLCRFPPSNNQTQKRLLNIEIRKPSSWKSHIVNKDCEVLKLFKGKGICGDSDQPKGTKNAAWFTEKVDVAEAQDAGQILEERELAFFDSTPYDSDCDDLSSAKVVLMENLSSCDLEVLSECLELEAELVKKNDVYNKLSKWFSHLEQHCISFEVAMQLNKEIFQKDKSIVNQYDPEIQEYFEQNDLKVQLQAKDTVISKLKETIQSLRENANPEKVKKNIDEIETIKIEMEHSVKKLLSENDKLHKEKEHLKHTYKELYDSIKPTRVRAKEQKLKGKNVIDTTVSKPNATIIAPRMYKLDIEPISHRLKNNRDAHEDYLKKTIENTDIILGLVERARKQNPSEPLLDSACMFTKHVQELLLYVFKTCPGVICSSGASGSKPTGNTKNNRISQPSRRTFTIVKNKCPLTRFTSTKVVPLKESTIKSFLTPTQGIKVYSKRPKATKSVVQIVLWYLDSGCSKYMTRNRSQLTNFINKFLGTVKFGNDQIAKIIGYGDYHIGNVTISRVYYVEGLEHNLFSVGQFCDSDLEVAFQKHTCFVRNLQGVDLLKGSRELICIHCPLAI
ncbi:hypothetical protein Tco_0927697 [Tanacetum coccineum]